MGERVHRINFAARWPLQPSTENIRLLKLDELIDLLAEETFRYTKMVKHKPCIEEFERCKRTVKELQSEIETRKANGNTYDH